MLFRSYSRLLKNKSLLHNFTLLLYYFLYFYANLEIFIRVFVYYTINDIYYFYRLIIIFTFNLNDIDSVF